MFRRDFFQRLAALTGASVTLGSEPADEPKPVEGTQRKYKVGGFSCPTCALGLEVQLRQVKGVRRAKASYEERMLWVTFDEAVITEEDIRKNVEKFGFSLGEA